MILQYKHYTITVLSLTLTFVIFIFGSLIIVDPLQIFHKPWVRDHYFLKELRFQAAGIINNSEFDSIILGTSHAANFSAKKASMIWNQKFVNISPTGSWFSERSVILKYALKKNHLKNVIMSLDGADTKENQQLEFSITNYDFLYNENKIDDLKIYANTKYFKYIFCGNIFSPSKNTCKDAKDLESVAEWASDPQESRRFGGLENWLDAIDNAQVKQGLLAIAKSTIRIKTEDLIILSEEKFKKRLFLQSKSFDKYIVPHIKKNNNTRFYFYFPPISRMLSALTKKSRPSEYTLYIELIRHITNTLEKYPNAKVFGFNHLDFTEKIANYKDTVHYHPRFNSAMLIWMKDSEHELTNENVEFYIKTITDLAENFDIIAFGEKIESFLLLNGIKYKE